jgi:hypothetical protein
LNVDGVPEDLRLLGRWIGRRFVPPKLADVPLLVSPAIILLISAEVAGPIFEPPFWPKMPLPG